MSTDRDARPEQDRRPSRSRAPYAGDAVAAERRPARGRGAWREAGRSWDHSAELLARDARARGRRAAWAARGDVDQLRRRARAEQEIGRALEPLPSLGHVVFHDRVLAGTSVRLDHVVVGPYGLAFLTAHPTTQLTIGHDQRFYDAGLPLDVDGEALRETAQLTADTVTATLPGWHVLFWCAVVLVGDRGQSAVTTPNGVTGAGLLRPRELGWWFSARQGALAPLHVQDLALAVERACPPAPLA